MIDALQKDEAHEPVTGGATPPPEDVIVEMRDVHKSFGEKHVPLARRFTDCVTLVLDGDAAGQKRSEGGGSGLRSGGHGSHVVRDLRAAGIVTRVGGPGFRRCLLLLNIGRDCRNLRKLD